MKKNGFTLIELLAVIVILAIIALIAVPIVLNIIDDSKNSSEKESIKLYMDHVQKMIAKEQMKDPTFNPNECEIKPKGILECKNETKTYSPIKIEIKGQIPESGTIKIENNKLEGINLKLDGLYYQVKNGEVSDGTKEQVSAGGAICTGGGQSTTIGTKYSCEVKPGKSFNFYVLSLNGDNVNLIMDRNICSSYTWEGNPNGEPAKGYYFDEEIDDMNMLMCDVNWTDIYNKDHYDNTYGPTGAMMALYVATKDWSNIPVMELSYQDEANHDIDDSGYISLVVSNGVGTITGKPLTNVTTIGTTSEPLKARLPMLREVTSPEAGCADSPGSCEPWLVEYLGEEYIDKYSSNEKLDSIYGYWLLSSASDPSGYALHISDRGYVYSNDIIPNENYTGIRPVITVPTSALGN